MKKNTLSAGVRNSRFAGDFTFVEPVNIYGAKFGVGCFVGPFVEIQSDVEIGDLVRIQSHSFICSRVRIGNNTFIGHGVVFVNDRFANGERANGDESKIEKTLIGNNVLIGSNATILPVQICDGVVIGAGSVVTKNIATPGTYAGNPAKLISKKIKKNYE